MDVQKSSYAQQQAPPPSPSKKRRRSSSRSPEIDNKRPVRSNEPPSTFKSHTREVLPKNMSTPRPLESFTPENSWSCPNCGRYCWLCRLSVARPLEHVQPEDEQDLERIRMASESVPSTTDTSDSKSITKKRKKDHYMQLGRALVGPRDQNFKQQILDPLGVYWTDPPRAKYKPPLFLSSQPLPQSRVIIGNDDENLKRITMDFAECKARQYNEHSLTLICCDSIILRDGLVGRALTGNQDQELTLTSVRRDKWKPLKQGPLSAESRYVYDWDLEPDTTYAVSVKMFNLEYRRKLHLVEFQYCVAEKDVSVCPYLTIEYKCSEKGGKEAQATNQAIAAAVLWLFQRKCLRDPGNIF